MEQQIEQMIGEIRQKVGTNKVLLGLSGGVDSSVTAALLDRAIGQQLTCVYVNTGLMRANETEDIQKMFAGSNMKLVVLDARAEFLDALRGQTDPETKRKIIGKKFYEVFWAEAKKMNLGDGDFFAQGTNQADVIESQKKVKSHHNLEKIPGDIKFAGLIEPLYQLFKSEVRDLGRALGLPPQLVDRQPFPGPGLGVRVMGEVTEEKLDVLRAADKIFRDAVGKTTLNPAQYFVALSTDTAVATRDGVRYDGWVFWLRCVETTDFMEANVTRLPHDSLEGVVDEIFATVPNTARVLFDLSPKRAKGCGATIEYQ